MATTLNYGLATTCLLDDAEAIHLRPQQTALVSAADISVLVQKTLADPVGYPPLAQTTIPGDTVVIAVSAGVPQQKHVIDGVLQSLKNAGADAQHITILCAGTQLNFEALKTDLAALGHSTCELRLHDPDNEKEMAFLGVSPADLPIRLNRLLCDADFVLPVGWAAGDQPSGKTHAGLSGLYPEFSDRKTIDRISKARAAKFPKPSADVTSETEQCSRLLGAELVLRVVPGEGSQIAALVAGESRAALREANAIYHSIWQSNASSRGSLAIATITGDQDQQTWQKLARVVAAAEAILEPEGSLVICTELAEPPGRALGMLTDNEDPFVIEREILRTPSPDCEPALVLCRALQQRTIYLRSRLRSSVVESLGLTPLESDSELDRLTQVHRPCVVLEEAQWLLPKLVQSEEVSDE